MAVFVGMGMIMVMTMVMVTAAVTIMVMVVAMAVAVAVMLVFAVFYKMHIVKYFKHITIYYKTSSLIFYTIKGVKNIFAEFIGRNICGEVCEKPLFNDFLLCGCKLCTAVVYHFYYIFYSCVCFVNRCRLDIAFVYIGNCIG